MVQFWLLISPSVSLASNLADKDLRRENLFGLGIPEIGRSGEPTQVRGAINKMQTFNNLNQIALVYLLWTDFGPPQHQPLPGQVASILMVNMSLSFRPDLIK